MRSVGVMGLSEAFGERKGFAVTACAAFSLFLAGAPVALSAGGNVPGFVKALSTSIGVLLGWLTCCQLPHRTRDVSIFAYVVLSLGAIINSAFPMMAGKAGAYIGCIAVNFGSGALYVIGMMLLLFCMIGRAWIAMALSLNSYFLGALFGIYILLPALNFITSPIRILTIALIILIPGVSASMLHIVPAEEEELTEKNFQV